MAEVDFLHEAGAARAAVLRDGMYCLRHRVFKERLGWNVTSVEGREQDKYDDLRPVYLLCRNELDEVEGCWRLMPTAGPYLLKDVFGELLYGHPAPQDPETWEISAGSAKGLVISSLFHCTLHKGQWADKRTNLSTMLFDSTMAMTISINPN